MTFHEQLLTATQTERDALLTIPFIREGAAGRLGLSSYLAFLEQAYHHVKHTVPLLMACGSRIPRHQEWLRTAVAEYIGEEIGHQEWILNDIHAAGGDAARVRHGQPSNATEVMVAYAYDIVTRRNPIGFFGMVLVLEGTSVALACNAAEQIQQSLGLPVSAFSYLRSHGTLDVEHMGHFRELMNQLQATADQEAVIHCAKIFYQLYGAIFSSLVMEHLDNKDKVA